MNVSPNEGGDVKVDGKIQTVASRTYSTAAGDKVNLEALASEEYVFDHWGGALNGSVNPTIYTFQDTTIITAYFVLKTEDVQYIDLTNTKNLIDTNKDIIVIDVSSVSDFNNSHLLCAKNYSWNLQLEQINRINELTPYKNYEILVYDRYGTNNGKAAEYLTKQKYFKSVYCMTDGLDDWIAAGHETFMSGNYPGGDTDVCTCIPPMAFAGANKTVNEKTAVKLTGQGSDPDGGTVSYLWTQAQGPSVNLSNGNTAQPVFSAPDLTNGDTELVFHLTVTDNEGDKDSDSVSVNVAWINQSPIANAGPDQSVLPGATVTLDSSGSTDPDGSDSLIYSWSAGPVYGVTAPALSNASAIQPTLTAPEQSGWMVYSLTVTDNGRLTSSDTVMISIQQESTNQAPTAVAETDKTLLTSGETATLNGSTSSDTDGSIVAYSWTQTDTTGISASLSSDSIANPTFTAPDVDDAATLIFSLIVTDDGGQPSQPSTVSVTVQPINQAPNAAAEVDKTMVTSGKTVTLDGSKSSDSDGSIAAYSWTQTDTTGISASLSSDSIANPTFTAPDVENTTTLTFSLIVIDDHGLSSLAATVSVNIEKSSSGGGGGCFISTINNPQKIF